MKTVAFVTSLEYSALTASDRIAAEELASAGIHVVPAIWNDPSVDWRKFDAIVIRSPWDYYLQPKNFTTWIDSLEQQQLKVWNSISILRWNINKRYLLGFQKAGIPVPRTCYLDD